VSVFAPLCENMTSSTNPEVRNVVHCRQSRTEPRSQVTLRRAVWTRDFSDTQADRRTNRQTHTLEHPNTSLPSGGELMNVNDGPLLAPRESLDPIHAGPIGTCLPCLLDNRVLTSTRTESLSLDVDDDPRQAITSKAGRRYTTQ